MLASVVVGALLLLLCGCQESSVENWSAEEVQQLASEYLASRYGANFTILTCYTKANSPGPIPVGGVHWELRVQSDQFPDEIFLYIIKKEKMKIGIFLIVIAVFFCNKRPKHTFITNVSHILRKISLLIFSGAKRFGRLEPEKKAPFKSSSKPEDIFGDYVST